MSHADRDGDGDHSPSVAPLLVLPRRDLPTEGLIPVQLRTGERAVVVTRGGVVAVFEDECPHQGMPLSAGTLCEDGTLECPWHGARYEVATGRCVQGPATDDLRAWRVIESGDSVVVLPD
ncbi:MAG: Rieske (2Fe-2S) protein [Gemmatimonadota bacterium]